MENISCALVCVDSLKHNQLYIIRDSEIIGVYDIFYYSDDSEYMTFTKIENGKESKSREVIGLYKAYPYGARTKLDAIILDLENMGIDSSGLPGHINNKCLYCSPNLLCDNAGIPSCCPMRDPNSTV